MAEPPADEIKEKYKDVSVVGFFDTQKFGKGEFGVCVTHILLFDYPSVRHDLAVAASPRLFVSNWTLHILVVVLSHLIGPLAWQINENFARWDFCGATDDSIGTSYVYPTLPPAKTQPPRIHLL